MCSWTPTLILILFGLKSMGSYYLILSPRAKAMICYSISMVGLSTSSIAQKARSVALKHPGVIVWDSNIHVTQVYRKICKSHQLPNSIDSVRMPKPRKPCFIGDMHLNWMCSDLMHPSGLVLQLYAEMLMNHMCYDQMKQEFKSS